MPISNDSAVDRYTIHEVHIELDEVSSDPVALEIILARRINGVANGEPSYTMNATELSAWLNGTPEPGLTRGGDLAKSLSDWVVSTGRVIGQVT